MRVCLVYDRLNKVGGAEAVLTQFARLYPEVDWYTSVWDPEKAPFSRGWRVHTSWLSRIPWLRTHHEWIPFLMPSIFESFDFSAYDLVISVSSEGAKGIITKPETLHVNYCLTPTRYLHSHKDEYLTNWLYRSIARWLRKWDLVASSRPDQMIAISTQVKKRIKDVYKRESEIIYPPIDTQKFAQTGKPENRKTGVLKNYYLTVSRLVGYKKIDLLVKTFNQNNLPLVIVGTGSEYKKLKKQAKENIRFVGHIDDGQLVEYYKNCKAFLHAGEEDFGIAMCEALACGKPVIAYHLGGASDIVQDGVTGILVKSQTVHAFSDAIKRLDSLNIDPALCKKSADRFKISSWEKKILAMIGELCQKKKK